MNKEKNSIQKIEELLAPIKKRPNIEPRTDFVNALQTKISEQKNRKPRNISLKPIISIGSAILLFIIIFLSLIPHPENANKTLEEPFPILEQSKVELVMKINYGEEKNQIGFIPHGGEGAIGSSATSFDVKNGVFYILDNVNKKVLIVGNGEPKTISINGSRDLSDILISKDDEIFVLDSGQRIVYQYSKLGELVEKYNIPDTIIPTGLGFLEKYGVTVNQNSILFSLKTGSRIPDKDQPYKLIRVNDTEGKIRLTNGKKIKEISIPFEHSYGGIKIHSVKDNQIVFMKGEILPNVSEIKGEFHIYVINKNGETQGAVRIPYENTVMPPDHPIKTSDNHIYFLSPESEYLAIYELKAGKSFEKLLNQQNEVVYDEAKQRESCAENDYTSNKNTVKIYFGCTKSDHYPESVKPVVKPVLRSMNKEEPLRNQIKYAIQELLKGPKNDELEKGFFSAFNDETSDMLNDIKLHENGHLIVNFTNFSRVIPNASTTTGSAYMMASLSYTISQFKEVQTIEYQFDGSCKPFYEWIQAGRCIDINADEYRIGLDGT